MKQEEIWNAIAGKWDSFRTRPVDEVVDFLPKQKGAVLDLGCGSGRNFIKNEGVRLYGVDFSSELLKLAEKHASELGIDAELKVSGADNIPYDDEFFDAAIFVRALHCVDSEEKRKKSLQELFRVLKSGSEAVVSVWSRGQDRVKNKDKVCYMPWTVGDKTYERYTYIYDKDEFENLLKSVGFEIVSLEEGKNIVAVVRKK
ncbi:MAG: class I SAM-dependent methyltransferase [Nanoarchaeota archaeon]|nr:class I SAM-dependent methyltransferase [Nanoarchaeota archaeon]